jgi:hypothetical protein
MGGNGFIVGVEATLRGRLGVGEPEMERKGEKSIANIVQTDCLIHGSS